MSCLVVGCDLLLLVRDEARLSLGACYDPIYCLLHLGHPYLVLVVASGQERRLVYEVCKVSSCKSRSAAGDGGHIHVFSQRLASCVNFKDLLPSREVGPVHNYLPIKASGPEKSGVQYIGAVGGGEHDDTALGVEAVHLHKELV